LGETSFSFDPDVLPELCPAPALFLIGRQDHWTGYKDMWKVLDNFPRGTFAVLDNAGHMVSYEQLPLAVALMSEWLDRVEEYIAQNA
jgi:pimeloyl-ACP methyl ester carboxylesterase